MSLELTPLNYVLEYAGVPFVSDIARTVRMPFRHSEVQSGEPDQLPPHDQQVLPDLVDELNRILPFDRLNDISLPSSYPGRNLGAIASLWSYDARNIKIGEYFYPTGARRWSMFRGLATSSMVKEMLAATEGSSAETFTMRAVPLTPNPKSSYTVETNLFMLPPRPMAEHGGKFDGLYLITLVDERFFWQYSSVSIKPTKDSTWLSLINQIATILGVTITVDAIPTVYGTPEPDSQLWTNLESAALLLDAIGYNIGRVVVRALDGTYSLLSPAASAAVAETNRGVAAKVTRMAGGDLFANGTSLPVGDLTLSKNSVLPSSVSVLFPKYVQGDDPVPHLLNTRYPNQRPSAWYEQSYGDMLSVDIPIQSGGTTVISGLIGVSGISHSIHSTAKALYSTEALASVSGTAVNTSGLVSLATQVAQDFYGFQVAKALDEVYPGTYEWGPEGIHDIIWTYSERVRHASTRVIHAPWNNIIEEMQHNFVPLSGYTSIPKGVGGLSVAQTIRDTYAATVSTVTTGTVLAGQPQIGFNTAANFPTQNRWRGQIDNEIILFEGTSGGKTVDVVYRGIDGTIDTNHSIGATVTQVIPDATYGVNLTTYEKGQFVFPNEWTSGGIQGVNVVPQTQTVKVLDGVGATINGRLYYSGQLFSWDTAVGGSNQQVAKELIFVVERNETVVTSGYQYDGQFVGFSSADPTAPVYAITQNVSVASTTDFQSITILVGNTTFQVNNVVIIQPPAGTDPGPTGPPGADGSPGPPGVQIYVPLKIDDWMWWGSASYTIASNPLNDWIPDTRRVLWRMSSSLTEAAVITGITPGAPPTGTEDENGQVLFLINTSALPLVLKNLDSRSLSLNQISTPDGYDLYVQPGGGIGLWHDPVFDRWFPLTMEAGGHTGTQDVVVNADLDIVTNNYINGRLQPPEPAGGGGSVIGSAIPVVTDESPPITGPGFTGDVATFTDPGGAGVPADYGAVIDWGDMSTPTSGNITGPDGGGVFTVTGSHIYTEEGNYTVTITLSHSPFSNTVLTTTATVSDPSVIAAGDDINVGVLLPFFNLSTAHFTDPGGAEALADYSATIDWGEGSGPQAGTISGPDPGGEFIVTGSWMYTIVGTYTITTTISHDTSTPTVVTSSATVF